MNHKELAVVNGLKEIGQDMIEQMNDNKYSFKFQVESDKVGEENVSASMLYFLHKKGLISTPRIVCKIKILTSERENTRGESKGA
ncbi:MAG: hypothetical protein HRU03_03395, partial [Nanoarchaeales archaeon]|nr:hypothetical protein [Nanoarchaeales archaeon]